MAQQRGRAVEPPEPPIACLQAQGKLVEAKKLYQRALTILEKSLGPEHPNVAAGLNNLALLLQVCGSTT